MGSIYPKAYLKRIASPGEHNSLANICMLAASESNAISDDDPTDYLPRLADNLGDDAGSVFASNYMSDPANVDYRNLSYTKFINLRSALIYPDMVALSEGKVI